MRAKSEDNIIIMLFDSPVNMGKLYNFSVSLFYYLAIILKIFCKAFQSIREKYGKSYQAYLLKIFSEYLHEEFILVSS